MSIRHRDLSKVSGRTRAIEMRDPDLLRCRLCGRRFRAIIHEMKYASDGVKQEQA